MSYKIAERVSNTSISPPARKSVARVLGDHAHEDGTSVYPSIATVARKCSLSDKQARRHVHALVEDGILVPDTEHPEPGATVRYHFDLTRLGPTDAEIKAARKATRARRATPPTDGRGAASPDGSPTPPMDGSPTPPADGSPHPSHMERQNGANPSHGREPIGTTQEQPSTSNRQGELPGERDGGSLSPCSCNRDPHPFLCGTDQEEPLNQGEGKWYEWWETLTPAQQAGYFNSRRPLTPGEEAEEREQEREARREELAECDLIRQHLRKGTTGFSPWERENLPGICAAVRFGKTSENQRVYIRAALYKIREQNPEER